MGAPTPAQRDNFTQVLRAHIAIARMRVVPGSPVAALDTLAHSALALVHMGFEHGATHGVGSFLNVHEGNSSTGIRAGMVLSNEPGYYVENQFGIRIENSVLVVGPGAHGDVRDVDDGGDGASCGECLHLETISLAPIQLKLVNSKLMRVEEILQTETRLR